MAPMLMLPYGTAILSVASSSSRALSSRLPVSREARGARAGRRANGGPSGGPHVAPAANAVPERQREARPREQPRAAARLRKPKRPIQSNRAAQRGAVLSSAPVFSLGSCPPRDWPGRRGGLATAPASPSRVGPCRAAGPPLDGAATRRGRH